MEKKKSQQPRRPIKISTEVIVLPGDRVFVENYRCRPPEWEFGTVRTVEIDVHKRPDDSKIECRPSYWVELDRKSSRGNMLTVTVSGHRIQPEYK